MTSTSVEVEPVTTVARRTPALLSSTLGIVLVLAGTVSILVLHVVDPTSAISPLRRTISEYAYSSLGWVFNSGVIAVAVGSLLIGISLWTSRALRPVSVGSLAIVAWSVSLAVLVVFPKHNWAVGPSGHGTIHRVASLVAFASVPIAAIVIARRRRGVLRWPARAAMTFGIIAGGWLALLLGGFIVGPITRTPWWQVFPLGLMERGMAFFAVAGVLALGCLAVTASRQRPGVTG